MNVHAMALICKALSDPHRLQIVSMLTEGEKCACKLLEHFAISQPTLSHHMKILRAAALIHTRRSSKWSHYSLNMQTLSDFRQSIGELIEKAESSPHGELR